MLLFMTMAVMSMLRRQAWMKWFPPMAVQSPSPITSTTVSSGRCSLIPVANARERPWVE